MSRLADIALSWVGGLTLVLLVLSAMGFWFFPQDLHDRALARDVQANGVQVDARGVEVHLVHHTSRYGDTFEVDQVRVVLPGNGAPVHLQALVGPEFDDLLDGVHAGWQQPTSRTTYDQDPLPIRVLERDGKTLVMAQSDLDYWTIDNHDPEIGLILGLGGLMLAGITVTTALWFDGRRRRPVKG